MTCNCDDERFHMAIQKCSIKINVEMLLFSFNFEAVCRLHLYMLILADALFSKPFFGTIS